VPLLVVWILYDDEDDDDEDDEDDDSREDSNRFTTIYSSNVFVRIEKQK
jgi:hypothetical protein